MSESNVISLREAGIQPGGDIEFQRSEIATDKAAAQVFMDTYGPYVKHNGAYGWLVWDNRRWKRDEEGHVIQMAMEVGDHFRNLAIQAHARHEHAQLVKHILAHARHCEKATGIRDFLKLAEPAAYTAVEDFDTYALKVNFRNETLDFADLQGDVPRHYPHSSSDNLTKVIGHDWHMGAPCHRWNAFVIDTFPSDEMRRFVQRAVGYSLLGTTREQCFFILWGTGANGKSTFLNIILRLIGTDYAMQADPQSFLVSRNDGIRNDLADLRGVRFLSAIETGDGKRLDEAVVKQATGGDPIRARHLYSEAFQFRPTFKLWLATNHKPTIRGTDYAIWRRVRLIPFTVTVPAEKRDPDLEEKLFREAEGILDWAVTGAVEYLRHGLQPPAEVISATAEYQKDEDTIGRFLEDRTFRSSAATVGKGELRKVYHEWCEQQGEFEVSAKRFGMYLKEQGLDEYSDGKSRYWIGVGIHA